MRYFAGIVGMLGLALALLASAGPASAQATRTWVSGVGDDVNPCSRTAPCKTFAGAISKTAPGGEINCLDPGGFGAVTITKSISIDCDIGSAGVLASTGNGVTINALATDLVRLRGLDIDGIGTGGVGVNILSAKTVYIENCQIKNFRAGTASGVATSGAVGIIVNITDTTLESNGVGIKLASTGQFKLLVAKRISVIGSTTNGLELTNSGATANVSDAIFTANSTNAIVGFGGTTGEIVRSQIVSSGTGVNAAASGASLSVAGNDFQNNVAAFAIVAGATIATDHTNRILGAVGPAPNVNISLQ